MEVAKKFDLKPKPHPTQVVDNFKHELTKYSKEDLAKINKFQDEGYSTQNIRTSLSALTIISSLDKQTRTLFKEIVDDLNSSQNRHFD